VYIVINSDLDRDIMVALNYTISKERHLLFEI